MLSAFLSFSLVIPNGLWFQTNSCIQNLAFIIILIHCLLLNTYVFLINFECLIMFIICILCKCIILWIIFLLDISSNILPEIHCNYCIFHYIQYICMNVVETIFLSSIWWTLMSSGFFAHTSSAIISIFSLFFCLRKYN